MRLDTVSQDLLNKLSKANPQQMRLASLAPCQIALKHSLVDTAVVLESLELLRQQRSLSIQRIAELNDLVARFDSKYFDLQNEAGSDHELQTDALAFFSQARAISALAFAGGDNPSIDTLDAVYETYMAVDDRDLVLDATEAALSTG